MAGFLWHELKRDPQSVRIALTAVVLGMVMALEVLWPRRAAQRRQRWLVNGALVLIAGVVLSLLPIAAIGVAAWAQKHGIGLLAIVPMPAAGAIAISIVALDAAMYWQHRVMHGPDWLWRLHRVHHSDVEFDTTTALRFHPGELFAVWCWKLAAIVVLGASPAAVLIFELLNGVYALFIHSNLRLPSTVDRHLRHVLVTPDLHRIHHSVHADEGNRNFGTILSVWDRCFASHCAAPREGHDRMQIGLLDFRGARTQSLPALLWQPLARAAVRRSGEPEAGRRSA